LFQVNDVTVNQLHGPQSRPVIPQESPRAAATSVSGS
jgi:hypothetical protein